MTTDVGAWFDAVADEPSPSFVARVEALVRAELAGSVATPRASTDATETVAVVSLTPVGRPARLRWLGLVAAVLAVALGISALAISRSRQRVRPAPQPTSSVPSPVTTTTSTSTAPTTAAATTSTTAEPTTTVETVDTVPPAVASPLWEQLPDSTFARRLFPVVAAAGEDVVVVGGHSPAQMNLAADHTDGVVLDTVSGTWRTMAAAPVPIGSENPSAWTGSELLVLASDGHVLGYDPKADRWRTIGVPSSAPRIDAPVAWTGTELLVGNGFDPASQNGTGEPYRPVSGEQAFSPTQGTWRTLPPSGLTGASVWTGSTWLRSSGFDRTNLSATPQHVRAYDPRTNRWTDRPDLPTYAIGAFVLNGTTVVAFDLSNHAWFLRVGSLHWGLLGGVPAGDQVSIGNAWAVDGHLIVDTGSGGAGGRYLGYRQSSGAWADLGGGFGENDDVIVRTASGRLVDTNGHAAGRLKSIVDPTAGVAACRRDQLAVSTSETNGPVIVLTNRSTHACTVDGQRPLVVEFRGAGSWKAVTPNDHTYLADGAMGGLVRAGGAAQVPIVEGPGSHGGTPCPATGPIDAVRFSLPDGELIEVAVTGAPTCPDLGGLAAMP